MLKARTKISIPDVIIVACAVVLSASLFIYPMLALGTDKVLIQTAKETFSYSLSDDRTTELSSNGLKLILEIKGGAVRISHSDCPDKLCVSSGWTKSPARLIVCVPAGVIVRVQNDGGDFDADVIAGR